MPFYTPLPARPHLGGPDRFLNIIDGEASMVQRSLRRTGLAGYEPPTVSAILSALEMQHAGFTFFDVGANVGLYSSLCAMLFRPGQVVAFEPTPKTAGIAADIARANGTDVRIEQIALGSTAGTAELYLSAKSDASNSLVEGFKKSTGTITVVVEPLDDFVQRSGLAPDIIKIDAETFEPQILAGARRTLDRHRPTLIVEVLHRGGHDHGVEITDAMDGLGYSFYHCAASADWQPSERISGDPDGNDRDWLLAPVPLPDEFRSSVESWADVVSRCTPDRNTTESPTDDRDNRKSLLDRLASFGGRAGRRTRRR